MGLSVPTIAALSLFVATAARSVTVQQAFKNTSLVTYAGPGAPPDGRMVVPNADFAAGPGGDAAPGGLQGAAVPAGYAVVQRFPATPSGAVIELLMDRRITPALRDAMWPFGGPEMAFEDTDPVQARLTRPPLLNAQLMLLSPAGDVVARKVSERPLAKLEPAPLHGLPSPGFLFTEDSSVGMGGFNGPFTKLLVPAERRLEPAEALKVDGKGVEPVAMVSTMHASWRIAPARANGRDGTTEEIEQVGCGVGGGPMPQSYSTYRFLNGRWTVATQRRGECAEVEVFPSRHEFP